MPVSFPTIIGPQRLIVMVMMTAAMFAGCRGFGVTTDDHRMRMITTDMQPLHRWLQENLQQ